MWEPMITIEIYVLESNIPLTRRRFCGIIFKSSNKMEKNQHNNDIRIAVLHAHCRSNSAQSSIANVYENSKKKNSFHHFVLDFFDNTWKILFSFIGFEIIHTRFSVIQHFLSSMVAEVLLYCLLLNGCSICFVEVSVEFFLGTGWK